MTIILEESQHIILLIIASTLFILFSSGIVPLIEVPTPVIISPGLGPG